MFTASIGNVCTAMRRRRRTPGLTRSEEEGLTGSVPSSNSHKIQNFFETNGVSPRQDRHVDADIFVAVPVANVRPYGIFGFGFIRQRRGNETGGLFADLSDDDVGYSVGGGVTFRFASRAGVRGDFRHFKVRTANGLSFQRLMVGLVLGG
jgi:hypothetical protein